MRGVAIAARSTPISPSAGSPPPRISVRRIEGRCRQAGRETATKQPRSRNDVVPGPLRQVVCARVLDAGRLKVA